MDPSPVTNLWSHPFVSPPHECLPLQQALHEWLGVCDQLLFLSFPGWMKITACVKVCASRGASCILTTSTSAGRNASNQLAPLLSARSVLFISLSDLDILQNLAAKLVTQSLFSLNKSPSASPLRWPVLDSKISRIDFRNGKETRTVVQQQGVPVNYCSAIVAHVARFVLPGFLCKVPWNIIGSLIWRKTFTCLILVIFSSELLVQVYQ